MLKQTTEERFNECLTAEVNPISLRFVFNMSRIKKATHKS